MLVRCISLKRGCINSSSGGNEGAMDIDILEALFRKGVPVFNMESNMNTLDVGWGSRTFHAMGREKVFLVNKFLSLGAELLMCDTDMVWVQVLLVHSYWTLVLHGS